MIYNHKYSTEGKEGATSKTLISSYHSSGVIYATIECKNYYCNNGAHLKSVFVSFGTGSSRSNLSGTNSSALSQTLQNYNEIYRMDQDSELKKKKKSMLKVQQLTYQISSTKMT